MSKIYQILKLTPGLFHNTFLTTQNEAHPTQIADFGSAYHQRIDIETSAS